MPTADNSLELAREVAKLAADKMAENIVILDMRKVANFCDFFVIATGTSSRQVQAVANWIEDGLTEKFAIHAGRKQGLKEGRWAIMDFGSVVAHIFDPDTREFYGIEYLWQGAKRVALP